MKTLLRWLALPFEWIVALVILFEEWGWEPLQDFMERLGRWPPVTWVESRVRALPPRSAVLVFALPSVLLLPVNLFAFWMTAKGQLLMGSALIVGAKLLGTTLVARIFTLTRPALLELPWFARLHSRWQVAEAKLLGMVGESWVCQAGRKLRQRWTRRKKGLPF